MPSLLLDNLQKTYPNGVRALDHIKLEVKVGLFGLLGPNGAGKSSLLRTIATLQLPDAGTASFDNIDILSQPMALRRTLGYLPQSFGVYPRVSALELLRYFAKLKGLHRRAERAAAIERVLSITNLTDVADRHVSTYSGGMKQRFGIAQLLLANPRLIIVDEPTAGLDPSERHRFLEVLRAIGQEKTVILSTHIVEDVRERCNDLAIMHGGRIVVQGPPAQLIKEYAGQIWTICTAATAPPPSGPNLQQLSSRFLADGTVEYRVYAASQPGDRYTAANPRLEDVYFLTVATDQIPA